MCVCVCVCVRESGGGGAGEGVGRRVLECSGLSGLLSAYIICENRVMLNAPVTGREGYCSFPLFHYVLTVSMKLSAIFLCFGLFSTSRKHAYIILTPLNPTFI